MGRKLLLACKLLVGRQLLMGRKLLLACKLLMGRKLLLGRQLLMARKLLLTPFGNLSTGFGTNTSNSGFFSNFGKPNTTPMLGGQTQNTGFGEFELAHATGLGGGLGTSFQAKPAAAPAFSNLGTGSLFAQPQQNNTFRTATGLGGGLGTSFQAKPAAAPAFSNLGTGSLFAQPQQNNTFRTGLDSGLGNSMFGATPSLGTGLSLGGFNANTTQALG
ncbi:hypothetical protein RR48_03503 [Papilio machaon]|uniref:Nuclear pore complex protein Nup98-Nup96 n=1 Tax=Papilio machaon TaxID=76193 RepID=A0A0N1I9F9_PAPMA|nr:hypothetical protein RR48_03503 [Papilio machaon]